MGGHHRIKFRCFTKEDVGQDVQNERDQLKTRARDGSLGDENPIKSINIEAGFVLDVNEVVEAHCEFFLLQLILPVVALHCIENVLDVRDVVAFGP